MAKDIHFTPHPDQRPDAWHRHTLAEGLPQSEHAAHVDVRGLLVAFLLTSVGVAAVIIVIVLYFQSSVVQARRDRIETTVLAAEANEYRQQTLLEIAAVRAQAFDEVIANYGGDQ
ncbi:MAG: hypothetical protein ACF8R7_04585 [Phycisphaerales bacterium JB039]